MSRPIRADRHPRIKVKVASSNAETNDHVAAARRTAAKDEDVFLSEKTPPWTISPFVIVYDEDVERRLLTARKKGIKIDEGLLFRLMRLVEMAKAIPLHDARAPKLPPGYQWWELKRVGSRVHYSSLDALAAQVGVSRSHLHKHLRNLRTVGIIINDTAHGWFEFDPWLVWRGKYLFRNAYIGHVMGLGTHAWNAEDQVDGPK
jgi:hypothetical protein